MPGYLKREDAILSVCRALNKYGGCKMGPPCPDVNCSKVCDIVDTFFIFDNLCSVVTCKECKYSDTYPPNGEPTEFALKCLNIRYGGVMPDWYCEHGEKKP